MAKQKERMLIDQDSDITVQEGPKINEQDGKSEEK